MDSFKNLFSFNRYDDAKILLEKMGGPEVPEEWKTYRTSLRDMDFSNPDDIVFPEVPTS